MHPKRGMNRLIEVAYSVNDQVHPLVGTCFREALHHLVYRNELCSACRCSLLRMAAEGERGPHIADIASDLLAYDKALTREAEMRRNR